MHSVRLVSALAAAAAAVALLLAPAARADGGDVGGTSELLNVAPANDDPILAGAVRAADAYWARMGMPPNSPAEMYVYDDADPDTNARGDTCGNRVWITRRMRASANYLMNDPKQRRVYLVSLAATMTHERGHNLCLTHESGWPIMRHDADGTRTAPTECWEWAMSVAPDKKPRARSARRAERPANWSQTKTGVSR